jgi:site-specific DNA recombinase
MLERLMEPALFEEFAREFIAEVNRQRSAASATMAHLWTDLADIGRQVKRLVDAIIDGADAIAISSMLKELEAEKARLTNMLGEAPEQLPALHPNIAMLYRTRVEALGAVLRDPDRGREAVDIIRSLIKEVRPVPADGELTIELRGELAGILALAGNAKQPLASGPDRALQIKMVAGACNRLDLQLRELLRTCCK